MAKKKVLVVDDEESMRIMLKSLLEKEGYQVTVAEDGRPALELVQDEEHEFDVIISDLKMPELDGLSLLSQLRRQVKAGLKFILMSAYGDIESAVEGLKLGAYDYIRKPSNPDEVMVKLKRALKEQELQRENLRLRRLIQEDFGFEDIFTRSRSMLRIFTTIDKVADFKSTVLLIGESGTGKELIARAIHHRSTRQEKPFVAVNCGAIPETLLESELFGHVKGAFTDAIHHKKGLFEEADGGVLFLDEIGELPLSLQVKLLRALQEEEVRRVGDTIPIKVDARIIAATVKDLAQEVEQGNFREDLYYRLSVLPIRIPPLRERLEDIPLLVDHFVEKKAARMKIGTKKVSPEILKTLMTYHWPGNVRELENTIERAMILAEGEEILIENLPEKLREAKSITSFFSPDDLSIKKATKAIERELIIRALKKTNGNRTHAASALEISHRALLYKIKEYGIEKL